MNGLGSIWGNVTRSKIGRALRFFEWAKWTGKYVLVFMLGYITHAILCHLFK